MSMQYKATRISTGGSHYLQGFVEAIRKVTSVAETTLSLDEQRYLSLVYHKLTWASFGRQSAVEISDIVTRLRKLALTAKSEYVIDSHLLIIKNTDGHIVITVNAKKGSFFPDVRFATPTGDAFKLELTKSESPVRPMRKDLAGGVKANELIINRKARENAIRILLDDNELSKTLCPSLRSDVVKALNEHFNKKQPEVESAINSQLICENAVRVLLGDNALTCALGSELQSEITKVLIQYIGDKQLKANVDLNKDAGVTANSASKRLLGKTDDVVVLLAEYNFGVSEPGMANALNSVDDKHCPTGYVVRKRLTNHTNLTDFAPSDAPYKINFGHVTSGGAVKTLLRDIRECRWDRVIDNALAHADVTECSDMWFAFKVGFTGHGPFAVFWIDQLNHQCYARMMIDGSVYEINPTM